MEKKDMEHATKSSSREAIRKKIDEAWSEVRSYDASRKLEQLKKYIQRNNIKKVKSLLEKNKEWFDTKEVMGMIVLCKSDEMKKILNEFVEKKSGIGEKSIEEREIIVKEKSYFEKIMEILWGTTKTVARKSNPVYIGKVIRDDIRQFRKTKAIKDVDIAGDEEKVRATVELKLAIGIAISEIVGTYFGAVGFGMILQIFTGNPYMGVVGTILGDYFPAFLSFDVVWFLLNKDYYTEKTNENRVWRFIKDVLPLHAAGVVAAFPAYVVAGAVSTGFVAFTEWVFPSIAKYIPVPLFSEFLNLGVSELIYLSLLGGMALTYSEKIIE
ncbi:MAG: hypothetical protein QXL47_01585, partial [Candidatus Anstonellales archaeon]